MYIFGRIVVAVTLSIQYSSAILTFFQITLALAYLFVTLGYSAIPGVIIMVIFLPSNVICSIIVKKWQVKLSIFARHLTVITLDYLFRLRK